MGTVAELSVCTLKLLKILSALLTLRFIFFFFFSTLFCFCFILPHQLLSSSNTMLLLFDFIWFLFLQQLSIFDLVLFCFHLVCSRYRRMGVDGETRRGNTGCSTAIDWSSARRTAQTRNTTQPDLAYVPMTSAKSQFTCWPYFLVCNPEA